MAAALVVTVSRKGQPVAIAATGFEADGTLVVSIDELGVSGSFTLDASGDLASPSPLTWVPYQEGTYTVRADDGTDELIKRVQVFTSA